MKKEMVNAEEREKEEREEEKERIERSVSHKALHPPLCGHKQPLYGVRSKTASRKTERKGNLRGGGEGRGDGQNLSSEFLILRNRRRIPEKFHSEPAIPGISLAPFPGTRRVRGAPREWFVRVY